MKSAIPILLSGAAGAAGFISTPQHVFQAPEGFTDAIKNGWNEHSHRLEDALASLTEEAKSVWDEVSSLYPAEMAKASFFSSPKKHNRKPDSQWDHIVRGQDVRNLRIKQKEGPDESMLDNTPNTYDLRVKKVDPGVLGVDPGVKQYSGYLDDNEEDKHLFYCKCSQRLP